MQQPQRRKRLLIYSHDSFGLGHLRRCREIAHSLVAHSKKMSVLILSGSPIIGSFGFRSRVDFVRIPGVIKLRHGDYTSLSLDIAVEETLAMRASIIRHTAEAFKPDMMLVDKEPLGLRGEMKETLLMLKDKGVPLVLGLRDVMDDPEQLRAEWERKKAIPALQDIYDHLWVYGPKGVCNPLEGMDIPPSILNKMYYTGYIRRAVSDCPPPEVLATAPQNDPYILVTTGGGGDGAGLVDWVLRAYENDKSLKIRALVVLGPFMSANLRSEFIERVKSLDLVEAITFDANVESLIADAAGVISMGGYNSFCEILSFDQRAIIVPRTVPRLEQYIRAAKAEEMGLVRMLVDNGTRDPHQMAEAIKALPHQQRPSSVNLEDLMEGLPSINRFVDHHLHKITQTTPD